MKLYAVVFLLLSVSSMFAEAAEKEVGKEFTQLTVTCSLRKTALTFETNSLVLKIDTRKAKIESSDVLRNTSLVMTTISNASGGPIKELTTKGTIRRDSTGRPHIKRDMNTAILVGIGSEEDTAKHIVNLILYNLSTTDEQGRLQEVFDADLSITTLDEEDRLAILTKSKKCTVQIADR